LPLCSGIGEGILTFFPFELWGLVLLPSPIKPQLR
jgi:hypothetical protein